MGDLPDLERMWVPSACPISAHQPLGCQHVHTKRCWPDDETRPVPLRRPKHSRLASTLRTLLSAVARAE